ncbi:hypothetical protein ATANTOWER_015762 [Ataeniobius toweri]|uniref:Uncharacterized protein n=1 Tax=Ataeniobius toweri TaxID=208326 RepID=A0ABU7BIY4_9TELE|nr:hypothetical protein [Ataeniobius toweri]
MASHSSTIICLSTASGVLLVQIQLPGASNQLHMLHSGSSAVTDVSSVYRLSVVPHNGSPSWQDKQLGV